MSITIPSSSRAARRKVASTTYVAPCRRWAGPKTSPRRLWAISMWSRTVTLNTSLRPFVGDRVAERREAPGRETRHDAGQLLEPRLAGDEHVERGIAQQVERERQPVGHRAPRAPGRRDRPHLAGAEAEAVRVERPAERDADLRVAVPAQLDHRALGPEEVERALEPGRRRARVD